MDGQPSWVSKIHHCIGCNYSTYLACSPVDLLRNTNRSSACLRKRDAAPTPTPPHNHLRTTRPTWTSIQWEKVKQRIVAWHTNRRLMATCPQNTSHRQRRTKPNHGGESYFRSHRSPRNQWSFWDSNSWVGLQTGGRPNIIKSYKPFYRIQQRAPAKDHCWTSRLS